MSAVLAAALAYARFGIAVFPVTSAVKKSHKSAEHSNGAKWGATNDPAEVRRDFTHWPGARIGIPTGAINKIVVVETDTEAGHGIDGQTALDRLEAKYGPLPETRTTISPSGSIHRYLKHPGDGIKIKNSASEIGTGIDVRGDGGMVVAPPSINPDGRRYRWLNRSPIAAMPAWLIELTREKPRSISQRAIAAIRPDICTCDWSLVNTATFDPPHIVRRDPNCPRHPIETSNAYGAAALEYEIEALTNTAPGSRNHALNRASFSLHQLVAGGELDGAEVERHLYQAAEANGLIADDGAAAVLRTIESGRRAGFQHPRSRSGAA
jgi:Bifunctional DNA primase/polymerase, N-terminal